MTKTLRQCLICLFCLSSLLPLTARADDDVYTMLLYELENNQFLPLLQNLGQLTDIKSLSQQTLANLQGNFGYGHLYNAAADVLARQWSNTSWLDVMNMANGGSATAAFYQAQQAYAKRYQVMNPSVFNALLGVSNLNKHYYADNSQVSRAALAASSYSYGEINQHMQTVSQLLNLLENNPSEKAAIDLTARLVAEQSFIALEQLRLQNFQTQLSATHSQAAANGMSDQASFMQWSPN